VMSCFTRARMACPTVQRAHFDVGFKVPATLT
jgi:hypothetical protein